MTVYVYGCATCGLNGTHLNKIKKYAHTNNIELDIRNSKHSETDRIEHSIKLNLAGLDMDTYQPIVVEGDKVTRLREWAS